MKRHNGAMISVKHLNKMYGKSVGISDVSFEVKAGEVLGFVGPNGAGKTTTMRILLGLIRATSGQATILGQNALTAEPSLRRHIGYLPGVLGLYRHLTGFEYLTFIAKMRGRDCQVNIEKLADQLNVDLTRHIEQLSKGNRQKLGVIQAFMHEPSVLILDEPTSGLDPLVQHAFEELIRERTSAGSAILLSSHVLSEVEELAHRVAIIHDAHIIAFEDLSTLRSRAGSNVEFTFHSPQPNTVFESLPGVSNVHWNGDVMHCTVVGSEEELLRRAVQCGAWQVHTSVVSLEDLFNAAVGAQDAVTAHKEPVA